MPQRLRMDMVMVMPHRNPTHLLSSPTRISPTSRLKTPSGSLPHPLSPDPLFHPRPLLHPPKTNTRSLHRILPSGIETELVRVRPSRACSPRDHLRLVWTAQAKRPLSLRRAFDSLSRLSVGPLILSIRRHRPRSHVNPLLDSNLHLTSRPLHPQASLRTHLPTIPRS